MSRPDFERAMGALAAATDSPRALPDGDLIWRRAAALARWKQSERATQPIRVAERAACIVCAVTGVAPLLAIRPGVEAALRAMDQAIVLLLGTALAVTAAAGVVLVRALSAEE